MRFLAVTLLAVLALASPAFAQTQVSGLSATNATPTQAAGARTVYRIGFTTSSGPLSGSEKIHIALPTGAGMANWTGGDVVVGGARIGGCTRLADPNLECWLNSGQSIGASTQVSITIEGVKNPTDAGSLTVTTDKDTAPASVLVDVVVAHPLTGLSVDNSTPTQAAGARTVYKVAFTTSSTGGLSEEANSRINLAFAAGTSLANWTGGTVTVAGTTVGSCTRLADPNVECWLYSGRTIAPSTAVLITFEGVTNPGGNGALSVATTSDPTAQNTPVTVVGAQSSSGLTVDNTTPTQAAGARTVYKVAFTTSSTGGLSEAANSRIDLAFADGHEPRRTGRAGPSPSRARRSAAARALPIPPSSAGSTAAGRSPRRPLS